MLAEIPGIGNVDVSCQWLSRSWSSLCAGVVETGLFVNMAARVYYGQADGTVEVFERQGLCMPLGNQASVVKKIET